MTPVATTVERIKQAVTHVNQAEKQALLTLVLQKPDVERALVFSRTKHGADKIVRFLEAAGIKSNAIHGNKSQGQRERALGLFRSGDVKVLIATDIAARGIDIPGVSHVVNFDLPDVPEQYVHRIGRTARAGASGQAIAFCSRDERVNLKDIEKLVRIKLPEAALPEGFMAAVEAIKRLKPAPKQTDSRERQPHGGRRFTATASLKPGHSRGGPRRDGQRAGQPARDGQNSSGPRANPLRDNGAQPQRHPQRAANSPGTHNAHRPEGGQPKRPFGTRGGRGRGRPGGNTGQRAHG